MDEKCGRLMENRMGYQSPPQIEAVLLPAASLVVTGLLPSAPAGAQNNNARHNAGIGNVSAVSS